MDTLLDWAAIIKEMFTIIENDKSEESKVGE